MIAHEGILCKTKFRRGVELTFSFNPCTHVTSNDVAESAQECYTKRYVTGFGRLNREPPCFRVDTLSKGAVWL